MFTCGPAFFSASAGSPGVGDEPEGTPNGWDSTKSSPIAEFNADKSVFYSRASAGHIEGTGPWALSVQGRSSGKYYLELFIDGNYTENRTPAYGFYPSTGPYTEAAFPVTTVSGVSGPHTIRIILDFSISSYRMAPDDVYPVETATPISFSSGYTLYLYADSHGGSGLEYVRFTPRLRAADFIYSIPAGCSAFMT